MSFGGGVQSTAVALLAINRDQRLLDATGGHVPELYIFADTGDEPADVYKNVRAMAEQIRNSGARFETVFRYDDDRRRLSDQVCGSLEKGKQGGVHWIPAFVATDTSAAPLRRGCTVKYKIEAVHRAARRLLEVKRGTKAPVLDSWMGISTDEIERVRDSREKWQVLSYPLIKMGWRRSDCANYIKAHSMTPVRSACVFCPFRSNREWQAMKDHSPGDFAEAVAFENRLHAAFDALESPRLNSKPYLHRSREPLGGVDFTGGQLDLPLGVQNECLGMCGV